MTQKTLLAQHETKLISTTKGLLEDLRMLIDQTRANLAVTVNISLTMLNWKVGKRIREEVLLGERAEYGKQIIVSLARQLMTDYGNSFTEKNLTPDCALISSNSFFRRFRYELTRRSAAL